MILIACEFSGIVREAFRKRGYNAWSCDLLPSEMPSEYHIQGNVEDILDERWEAVIAFPPCTYLTVSGNKWMLPKYAERFPTRVQDRQNAIEFFMKFVHAPVKHIAIENPVGIMSTVYKKPSQYIQPYYFGHPETKKTGLWLKNLPILRNTKMVKPEFITGKYNGKMYSRIHYMSSRNGERWRERSRTYQGIADAMAEQWGPVIEADY